MLVVSSKGLLGRFCWKNRKPLRNFWLNVLARNKNMIIYFETSNDYSYDRIIKCEARKFSL